MARTARVDSPQNPSLVHLGGVVCAQLSLHAGVPNLLCHLLLRGHLWAEVLTRRPRPPVLDWSTPQRGRDSHRRDSPLHLRDPGALRWFDVQVQGAADGEGQHDRRHPPGRCGEGRLKGRTDCASR
eukprot:7514514-Pyramimonas_sp.AAC.1